MSKKIKTPAPTIKLEVELGYESGILEGMVINYIDNLKKTLPTLTNPKDIKTYKEIIGIGEEFISEIEAQLSAFEASPKQNNYQNN